MGTVKTRFYVAKMFRHHMTLQAGNKCLYWYDVMILHETQTHVDLVCPCLCSSKGVVCELACYQQIPASARLVASTATFGVIHQMLKMQQTGTSSD